MKHSKDQRGVVGIALLALVLIVAVGAAGFYVYQVRSDKSTTSNNSAGTAQSADKQQETLLAKDPDASVIEKEGRAADAEDLDYLAVSDSDIQ